MLRQGECNRTTELPKTTVKSILDQDSNFCLRGPFFQGPYSFYRLFEKSKQKNGTLRRKNIILQTPLVCLASLGEKTLSISLDNIHLQNNCRGLVRSLQMLETNLQTTSSRLDQAYQASRFRPSITTWMNTNYLRLSQLESTTPIYNQESESVSSNCLQKGCILKALVWVKGIRQYSDCWKLELVALQLKVYDPVPSDVCLIEDEIKECNRSPNESDPYQLYRNMLQKGVPRMGVEQKCRLAGLDPTLIDQGGSVGTRAVAIGEGKRVGEKSGGGFKPVISLSDVIASGVKLKKTSARDSDQVKPRTKIRQKAPSNQLVPSLDDILGQLSRLRPAGDGRRNT